LKTTRRISQIFFLLFFLLLFLSATYPLKFKIPVDFFFRMDPLLAISSMVSARAFINTFIWAFFILILTVPLGRYFCGWICPLGTTLDSVSFIFKKKAGKSYKKIRWLKYAILIFLLIGAVFSSQLVWFFDPLALLARSLTLTILPIITVITNGLLALLFDVDFLQDPLIKMQGFFSSTFLPTELTFFRMSGWVLLIFLAVVLAEFVSRRFWCRNVCPLGALLAFFSKFQILRRKVKTGCTECGDCEKLCKMDAIKEDFRSTDDVECIQCFNCVKACPPAVTTINFKGVIKPYRFDLKRRRVVASAFAGLVSVGILKTSFVGRNSKTNLIRPPGAREENEFLDRCIRCHKCIKVCSASGRFLQPAFGLVYIDRDRCIPWYKNEDCIVCQEHCPTPQKAIELKQEKVIHFDGSEKLVKRPYVREDLCIGCGICETKCPIEGKSAIIVTPQGEQRWSD